MSNARKKRARKALSKAKSQVRTEMKATRTAHEEAVWMATNVSLTLAHAWLEGDLQLQESEEVNRAVTSRILDEIQKVLKAQKVDIGDGLSQAKIYLRKLQKEIAESLASQPAPEPAKAPRKPRKPKTEGAKAK